MNEVLGFFSLGLFGGFGHCVFMCNPFVLFISSKFAPNVPGYFKFLIPQIKYNLGRIITYIFLGVIFNLAKENISLLFSDIVVFQKVLAILAGIFLISYALFDILGVKIFSKLEDNFFTRKIRKVLSQVKFDSPFFMGLVLGFLPCGLLYGVLIGVSSLNNTFIAGLSIGFFGVGTSVSLLLISIFGNFILKYRTIFRVFSFIVMMAMGIFFVVSGIRF